MIVVNKESHIFSMARNLSIIGYALLISVVL